MAGTLEIAPLSGALGARVEGVELREPLAGARLEVLREGLAEHGVLIFPDQGLDDAGLLALARCFGEPYLHPISRLLGASEAHVEHIVDSEKSRPFQDRWHTDVSFSPEPPTVGLLRAIEIPARGGDTVWASSAAAYEALSPVMQRILEPLVGVHDPGLGEAFREKAGEAVTRRVKEAFPGTEHPVVGTHPRSGRRYLYVNAQFTRGIAGMHAEESERILRFLFEHMKSPNLHYRHRWTAGDVALWDERTTQHFAVADHWPQRREMARITVREKD